MRRDQMIAHDAAVDQMLSDNPLERWRIAARVPRAFGIHDGDRPVFTNAKAVGFRAENAALLGEAELLQPPLEKFPGGEAAFLLTALRRGLIAAEKNVPLGDSHTDRGGNLCGGGQRR